MSANGPNFGPLDASHTRDFSVPLPLREQRILRREEVCSQHEEELARLARDLDLRRQEQDSERSAWEQFKTDLEAVQGALESKNRQLEALEELLRAQRESLAAEKRELAERSDKLSEVAQRLKQREALIDSREIEVKEREASLSSRQTAVTSETELGSPAAPSPAAQSTAAGLSEATESLSNCTSLIDSNILRSASLAPPGSSVPSFPPPPSSLSGYSQIELFAGDSEPSVIEQYAGQGLADAEMSVLMADQVILRAAAEGTPCILDRAGDVLSVLTFSR
jgi:hypothetical protein